MKNLRNIGSMIAYVLATMSDRVRAEELAKRPEGELGFSMLRSMFLSPRGPEAAPRSKRRNPHRTRETLGKHQSSRGLAKRYARAEGKGSYAERDDLMARALECEYYIRTNHDEAQAFLSDVRSAYGKTAGERRKAKIPKRIEGLATEADYLLASN